MLTIHNISKTFGKTAILKNVSLVVPKNTIIGLAGPSGGGKSTLLRCVQGLETFDTGTIECNGQTGFMFQDFQLFPHMSVIENLTYALSLKGGDHSLSALNMLEELGILEKAHCYPSQLSGGQKQRVALARSLMLHPELLLCDEPTSGLDVATIRDVANLLRSIRDRGVTMIIASHDLDFLTQIADRIVLLNGGSIVCDMNPSAIDIPIQHLQQYY
jgi:polar amino acid transport system ATP-binding protein